jgi:hypothetical protein
LILFNLSYAARPTSAVFASDIRDAAHELENAALAHNTEAFVHALQRWLGIAPALARRIASDPLGEPIVVAAKALGLASDALQRILLFINPAVGRSVSRVYELAMLFETLDVDAAQTLLGIWRAADARLARPAPTAASGAPRGGTTRTAAAPRPQATRQRASR